MKRINIFAVMLLFAISFLAIDLFAQRQGNRNFRGQRGGFWTQLNDTQKQEVQDKIKELRDAGATREDIRQAVNDLLQRYGIQLSENGRQRGKFARIGRHPFHGLLKDLDENQKKAIFDKLNELREAEKNPEEVHAEIGELLQSFGIELPANWNELKGPGPFGHGHRAGFLDQLTEEQKKEIRDKHKELRDQGAAPEEIHEAIKGLLNSYGVEVPENFPPRGHRGGFGLRAGFSAELSEEQKEAIQTKMKELRDQGANRQEIHNAVIEMLTDFGVELPDNFGSKGLLEPPGRGPHLWIFKELTEDQKKAIHEKVKQMREQDVKPQEIHTAVGEMLQSFGIDLPENWEEFPPFHGVRGHRGGFWKQLNETQKQELQEIIQSLKESGASRKEIREAVNAKLKEFGIEPPKGRKGNRQNQEQAEVGELNAELQELEARNYPNPFNPETNIVYTIQNPQKVSVRIFNTNGQLIRTLLDADQPAGTHTVLWDGRDENGVMATSGMYFYRINAGANSLTQGMILMK